MFFSIKLKRFMVSIVVILILIGAILSGLAIRSSFASTQPRSQYVVVIDAGHGARDGGAVGKTTGVSESSLNLDYALELASLCKEYGLGVVLTRKNDDALYDENAPNKKKSEMKKRIGIINNSGGDLMISIHMNSFPLSSCKGAYVFYRKNSEEGKGLASSVQEALCKSFDSARKYVTMGDYFVLNYSNIPSTLVECGFLTNSEEEILLQKEEYRREFCYSLLLGILNYFKM